MTENKITNLQSLEATLPSLKLAASYIPLHYVFAERRGSYLNEFNLFIAHFNTIPNFIHEINIDCRKANAWFMNHHEKEITDVYFDKRYLDDGSKAELDDVFYFLYDDLIVDFDTNKSIVRFLFRKTTIEKVEQIIKSIKKFKQKSTRRSPKIKLLINTTDGIRTKQLKITKPHLNIADNYNDDFEIIHQLIIKRLAKPNDKGIVLLHGKPGTGKTSYIRYLMAILKKDIIFLPPNMAAAITDPDLIAILIDHPNSIFVIEDAENIVIDRERNSHSPVSALLNISDGLLSDCLNIQIICSFNTDISTIDNALMRKGRLIAKYEFKELEINKAQALSNKLNFTKTINQPMALTEIYNQGDINFQAPKQRNTIGFKSYI